MFKTQKSNPPAGSRINLKPHFLSVAVAAASFPFAIGLGNQAVADELGLVLEEVIVTAQKRSESLQEVPIAVSAFSDSALQERGLLGGEDFEKNVPNVAYQRNTGFGATNFQIRGIGSIIESASADAGVGIHVNSVPITEGRFAQAEFYDMERVEVLRGPQGTLYGRNATGGVVNSITAKPEDEFSAKINLEYGNYNSRRIGGHLNIPVSETLAVRFAGNMIKRDGTMDNEALGTEVNSRDIWSGRFTSLWKPTDKFAATFMYEHFDQDDSSGAQKGICATDPGPDTVGGVPTDPLSRLFLSNGCLPTSVDDPSNTGAPPSIMTWGGAWAFVNGVTGPGTPGYLGPNAYAGQTYSSDLRTMSSSRDPQTIAENDLYMLNLEYDLGNGLTITSLTSYSEDDFVFTSPLQVGVPSENFAPGPLTPGGVFNDPTLGPISTVHSEFQGPVYTEQVTQELRLSSDFDGSFNFNLGGIYVDLEKDKAVNIPTNTTTMFAANINLAVPGAVYIDQTPNIATRDAHNFLAIVSDYKLQAGAIFGEAYYDINNELKATLGLRYTRDEKQQVNYAPNLYSGFGNTPGQIPLPENSVTFSELTGRFTLDWQATDNTLAYASISRGYKGGGFNGGNVSPGEESYEPEFVNALELGTKSSIADGRGTLNLTGFYYDYTGYQIARTENGVAINYNTDATVMGLELETVFQVTKGLQVDANVGYLKTEIDAGVQVDLYNLTQGNPDLTAVNSISGNSISTQCVVPTAEVAGLQAAINAGAIPTSVVLGFLCSGSPDGSFPASPNAIDGVAVDLKGNELPMSPELTVSIGAEYEFSLNNEWSALLRGDYSYRDESYADVFNTNYASVQSVQNFNASFTISSEEKKLDIQFYARNLLDKDAITSNRVFASNIGNYRQVSGKDPAFYGLRVSKSW